MSESTLRFTDLVYPIFLMLVICFLNLCHLAVYQFFEMKNTIVSLSNKYDSLIKEFNTLANYVKRNKETTIITEEVEKIVPGVADDTDNISRVWKIV